MVYDVFIILTVLLLTLYFYCTRNFRYWEKKGIRYEKPVPIFGNLWDTVVFRKSPGQVSEYIYKKYPDEKVVGMFHFDTPVLLIRDPELAHKIKVTDFRHFSDNGFTIDEKVDPVSSRNIFFQKGEKWKRTRQMMSPIFTTGRIKSLFQEVMILGNKLTEYISNNPGEVELKYLASRFTSEVVATCGFGIDGKCFEEPEPQLIQMGQAIFGDGCLKGIIQLAVLTMPNISRFFRVKFVPKEVPDFFEKIIRDVMQYREANPETCRKDMMQYWIDLKKRNEAIARGDSSSDISGQGPQQEDILAGCVTFFMEGYETFSMVVSFILYYLALNKEVQDRAKSDIDELYSSKNLSYEGVLSMTYLNNIMQEVLRLHPGVTHSLKTCTSDYIMDLGEGRSILVEKGVIVAVPNSGFGSDAQYWKDPDKFDPDRFSDQNPENLKKGVFLPFGDGPRMCIGMRLAYMVVKIAIIAILRNFEVVPTNKTPKSIIIDPKHFISRSRVGLYAKFVKRF